MSALPACRSPAMLVEGTLVAAERTHLLITLKDDYIRRSKSVATALKRAGLTNIKALASIGVVTGDAPASRLDDIREVPGVLAVEESTWTQLEPPDAPVQ